MSSRSVLKKRKISDSVRRPRKKIRKQLEYHSSSDEAEDGPTDDVDATNLTCLDEEEKQDVLKFDTQNKCRGKQVEVTISHDSNSEDPSDMQDEETDSSASASQSRPVSKRNDPFAFSTSISKILSTKLSTSARADPVMSRSKAAMQLSSEAADEKLNRLARARLRAEKKEELDRGRVRDVMGIERGLTGTVAEEEKRLRKIAQRGVVKLFNAVRASQVRGEEAARTERQKGTIGMGERERKANNVSKQGFLELISGKKEKRLNIEES